MPQRRTASRAKPPRRFTPAERVFHLVSADDFVTGEREARGKAGGTAQTRNLRAGATTSCCRKPVSDVYAVATSRASVQEGGSVRWCEGVR